MMLRRCKRPSMNAREKAEFEKEEKERKSNERRCNNNLCQKNLRRFESAQKKEEKQKKEAKRKATKRLLESLEVREEWLQKDAKLNKSTKTGSTVLFFFFSPFLLLGLIKDFHTNKTSLLNSKCARGMCSTMHSCLISNCFLYHLLLMKKMSGNVL